MTKELRPPRYRGDAIELGNRHWRTQLLPVGEIEYKGRTLRFDREYLKGLVAAFKAKAFDLVPFQLARDDNKHTNDPERYRGEVVGLEMAPDGLDLILEATEAGDELLRTNPRLGVSARIYEEYVRSDGKSWPQALQHVLATLDPHIPGMRSWKEIEVPVALSQQIGDVEVVDLSDATFGEEEGGTDEVAFSKEDRAALIELLTKARKAKGDDEIAALVDELIADSEVDDETELSDEELDKLIAEAESEANAKLTDEDSGEDDSGDESEEETEEEPEPVSRKREPVAASNKGRRSRALELANAQIAEQGEQLAVMQAGLDDASYLREREVFVRTYGIPPKIVDLARPLLEGAGHIVELSGGDEIDAGAVVRRVLVEFGNQIKLLDLSGVIGSGLEDDEEKEEAAQHATETAEFVAAARKSFGL
jgi:hypothetical protein